MRVEIDGKEITSVSAFHRAISVGLHFPDYYGNNLNALADVLSSGAGAGIVLVWKDSAVSRAAMPEAFDMIATTLRETADLEASLPTQRRFQVVFE